MIRLFVVLIFALIFSIGCEQKKDDVVLCAQDGISVPTTSLSGSSCIPPYVTLRQLGYTPLAVGITHTQTSNPYSWYSALQISPATSIDYSYTYSSLELDFSEKLFRYTLSRNGYFIPSCEIEGTISAEESEALKSAASSRQICETVFSDPNMIVDYYPPSNSENTSTYIQPKNGNPIYFINSRKAMLQNASRLLCNSMDEYQLGLLLSNFLDRSEIKNCEN